MSFPAYEEYRDSGVEWLGEVPEYWGVEPLKYLCDVKTGCAFKSEEFADDGVPVLRIGDISMFGTVDFSDAKYLPEHYIDENRDALVHQYDIVMAMTGATIGKAAKYSRDTPALLNQRVCIFRAKHGTDQSYIWSLLQTSYYAEYLAITAFGGAQPNISDSELVGIPVPVPPLSEQQAIASFLDSETSKIDGLVSEQRRLIELLKEKRQAVINHAVTKGLNPDVKMKPSGVQWLGDVPEHWEVKQLGYLVATRKGVAFKAFDFIDAGVGVVKASDIKELTIRTPSTFLPKGFIDEYPKAVLNAKELVLSTVGSTPEVLNSAVGQLGRVPANLAGSLLNQNTVVFSPDEETLTNDFLYYLIQTTGYRDHLDLHAHGTANQASLNVSEMLHIQIPIPSQNEQVKIIEYLDLKMSLMDDLSAQMERAIELLQERRTALISAAVTGKIDVRGFVAEEAVA